MVHNPHLISLPCGANGEVVHSYKPSSVQLSPTSLNGCNSPVFYNGGSSSYNNNNKIINYLYSAS